MLQKKVVMAFACTTQMSAFYYGTQFAMDAAANYSLYLENFVKYKCKQK